MKYFIVGGGDGIGAAFCNLLASKNIEYYAPTRQEFDATDYSKISETDFSEYTHFFYCAGSNRGTWRGFENNSWQNQLEQLETNFFSITQFAKQWINTNGAGTFIAVGSNGVQLQNNGYRLIYDVSKEAVASTINLLRANWPNTRWVDVHPGKTKTGILIKGYEGSRSEQEVEEEYAKRPYFLSTATAQMVWDAIDGPYNTLVMSDPHQFPQRG